MPSAHSATVCSLATVVGKIGGVNPLLFAVSVIFALIVMYDAQWSKADWGKSICSIKPILDEMFKDNPEFEDGSRSLLDIPASEIVVGAVLGIALAWWWA